MEDTIIKQLEDDMAIYKNECPIKDDDDNCLVPGIYRDSEPICGG